MSRRDSVPSRVDRGAASWRWMRPSLLSLFAGIAVAFEWRIWDRGEATWAEIILFVVGLIAILGVAWTRWRTAATVLVVVAFVGSVALPGEFNSALWFIVLPSLVDSNLRRPTWLGLGVAISVSLASAVDWRETPSTVVSLLVWIWFLSMVGMVLRSGREKNVQLREVHVLQTAQLRADAAAQRRQVGSDMHDYVAASVTRATAITRQVIGRGGLQTADREALETVESELVAAIDQVREIVLLLESDETGSPAVASQTAQQLKTAERVLREAGFSASTHVSGDWAELEMDSAAAHAILQEGVANAIQHGRSGGIVQILVDAELPWLQLTVVNQLEDTSQPVAPSRGGNGIRNLRHRVEEARGELEVAREEGTWILRAQLPVAKKSE